MTYFFASLPQQPTSGGVSSVCTVASVATAGATSSADGAQAQEVTGQLSAVVGTAASEVTVKTDPLEDESSSPTQEGVRYLLFQITLSIFLIALISADMIIYRFGFLIDR